MLPAAMIRTPPEVIWPFMRWLAVPVAEPSHKPIQVTVPDAEVTTFAATAFEEVAEAAALNVTATLGQEANGEPVPVFPGSPVW